VALAADLRRGISTPDASDTPAIASPIFPRPSKTVTAVDGISFSVRAAPLSACSAASGGRKTTTMR
jgi:hypothetical protein